MRGKRTGDEAKILNSGSLGALVGKEGGDAVADAWIGKLTGDKVKNA